MKVIHLNTFHSEGGAAKASTRLHESLLNCGVNSHYLTQGGDFNIVNMHSVYKNDYSRPFKMRLRTRLDSVPLLAYPLKMNTPWNVGWLNGEVNSLIQKHEADIVHVHWVGSGFMSLNDLSKIKQKLVFTLHDSWMFTGGCHVIGSCRNFQSFCTRCPQLGSKREYDLSTSGFQRRLNALEKFQPIFIAPSSWMSSQAKSSFLLKDMDIRIIPNGVNTNIFYPHSKKIAREFFGLSHTKKIIVFGANSIGNDVNKGFNDFIEMLPIISNSIIQKNVEFVVFGRVSESVRKLCRLMSIKSIGKVTDEGNLALLYSAADLVCVPSIQESFGLIALEAMSCGVPVVAYRTSGLTDIIVDGTTGFLAAPFDKNDFAKKIIDILGDDNLEKKMSIESRLRAVNLFDLKNIAISHLKLYENLLL
jgi:glycosyltransferase involved in cell wall biosynthesis